MKLINKAFDYRDIDERKWETLPGWARPDTDAEVDSLLGHTYERERKYQPKKQKMNIRWNRAKTPIISWWDERPWGEMHWHRLQNVLEGLIQKYEGRKFDEALTTLKERYMTDKDLRKRSAYHQSWDGVRNEFIECFEPSRRYPSKWMVDGEGIIRLNPTWQTRKRYKNRYRMKAIGYTYTVLPRFCKQYYNELKQVLGADVEFLFMKDVPEDAVAALRERLMIESEYLRNHCFDACLAASHSPLHWHDSEKLISQFIKRETKYDKLDATCSTKHWAEIGKARAEHKTAVRKARKKVDKSAYYDMSLKFQKTKYPRPSLGLCLKFGSIEAAEKYLWEQDHKEYIKGRWSCTDKAYRDPNSMYSLMTTQLNTNY